MRKGSIYSEAAYARGKMLDHSQWFGLLPRKITPSDIDMVIDNSGRILLIEISTQHNQWKELPSGQRKLYENLVIAGNGKIKAALATVSPQIDTPIKTIDVISFQIMGLTEGNIVTTKQMDGKYWIATVTKLLGFPFPAKLRYGSSLHR